LQIDPPQREAAPFRGGFFVVPAQLEIPMTETSPPDFLSDERVIREYRKVFVMFMGCDGYSREMSTEEFPRLRETVKLDACPKAYLRLQRTGSRFALDRRKKMEIVEIYHNAGEHAYYGYCKANGINPL
jgi:hypothetical protein